MRVRVRSCTLDHNGPSCSPHACMQARTALEGLRGKVSAAAAAEGALRAELAVHRQVANNSMRHGQRDPPLD